MKNIQLILAALISSLVLYSCGEKKDEEIEPLLRMHIEQEVQFKIKNADGVDLLNPSTEKGLKRFKVYYIVDGKKKLYFEPWLDAPGAYLIQKEWTGEDYVLRVLLSGPTLKNPNVNGVKTFLEFPDGHTDTITADYHVRPNLRVVTRAYYNDRLEWDRSINIGKTVPLQLTYP